MGDLSEYAIEKEIEDLCQEIGKLAATQEGLSGNWAVLRGMAIAEGLKQYVYGKADITDEKILQLANEYGLIALRDELLAGETLPEIAKQTVEATAEVVKAIAEEQANRQGGIFANILSGLVDAIAFPFAEVLKPIWGDLLTFFQDLKLIDEESRKQFLEFKKQDNKTFLLTGLTTLLGLVSGYVSSVIQTASGDFVKEQAKLFTPNSPDPASLLTYFFKNPNKESLFREKMGENGYSKSDTDIIVEAASSLLPVDLIINAFYRQSIGSEYGGMNEAECVSLLQKHGFDKKTAQDLLKQRKIVPSINDLLYLVGKEAFEPDQIALYGLNAEFPNEVRPWLQAQGLDDYFIDKYWSGHWEHPSLNMAFEMYQRAIINRQELEGMFRVHEYPPFWREKLLKLSYNPLTRVDIRRIHKLLNKDKNWLITQYKNGGYSPENAEIMADFTIEYNQGGIKELTQAQLTKMYEYRQLTRDAFLVELQDIGYTTDNAKLLIDLVDKKLVDSEVKKVIKALEKKYKRDPSTWIEVNSTLLNIGVSTAKREELKKLWDLSIQTGEKQFTKADITKFLETKLINVSKAINMLFQIGYSTEDAQLIAYATMIEAGELTEKQIPDDTWIK